MRGRLASIIGIATIVPSVLSARSEQIPTLDVTPVCRGIASQSADPGVGQGAQAQTFRQCVESEQGVREELKKAWSSFSAADKRHCVELAKTGGESTNTELLTCLEMARDVRILRSAAAGGSAPDTPKSTTPPSIPAAQPASSGTPSQPTAPERPSKATAGPTITDLAQAKAEAETAKASTTLAQQKLADAEAALQRAKEEIGRANAEAERAKAAEQAARESEAVAKRKLADAEGARAAAERACTPATRPGLMGRLRRWLRRHGANNQ
jgi:hypothetical protein